MLIFKNRTSVRWNSKNKQWFVSKGYKFTNMKDIIEVDVNDLKENSLVTVEFKCDYCGDIYNQKWCYYTRNIKRNPTIKKDACKKCTSKKTMESNLINYNVHSVRQIPDVNQKITNFVRENVDEIQKKAKQGVLKKYGVENPFQSEEIKKKIKEQNLEKYGVEFNIQRKEVVEKALATKEERYGKGNENILFENRRKENHPNWKGGISDENHILRTSDRYKTWRMSIFKKSNFKCERCGILSSKGIPLNAHHIYDWKNHIELRFDIDNGITLCENCHRIFHSKFKSPNNYDQIILFLKEFQNNHEENVC